MEEYFYDLEIGRPPKVLMKKEMTDKLDYTKIMNFWLLKYNIILRHVYPNVHRSTVYNSQDMEAT